MNRNLNFMLFDNFEKFSVLVEGWARVCCMHVVVVDISDFFQDASNCVRGAWSPNSYIGYSPEDLTVILKLAFLLGFSLVNIKT